MNHYKLSYLNEQIIKVSSIRSLVFLYPVALTEKYSILSITKSFLKQIKYTKSKVLWVNSELLFV